MPSQVKPLRFAVWSRAAVGVVTLEVWAHAEHGGGDGGAAQESAVHEGPFAVRWWVSAVAAHEADRRVEAGLAGGAAEDGEDGGAGQGDGDEIGHGATGVPAERGRQVEREVALELLGERQPRQVRDRAVRVRR